MCLLAGKIGAAQIAFCPTKCALKRRVCVCAAVLAAAKFPEWRGRDSMNRTDGLIGKGDDEHQCVRRKSASLSEAGQMCVSEKTCNVLRK